MCETACYIGLSSLFSKIKEYNCFFNSSSSHQSFFLLNRLLRSSSLIVYVYFYLLDYTRLNYYRNIKILICGCALVLKTMTIMSMVMKMMKCLQLMYLHLPPSPCSTTTFNLFSMTSATILF